MAFGANTKWLSYQQYINHILLSLCHRVTVTSRPVFSRTSAELSFKIVIWLIQVVLQGYIHSNSSWFEIWWIQLSRDPAKGVSYLKAFISTFQLSSWRSDSGMVQNQITYPALDFNNNDVSKIIWIRSSFVIIFSIYFIHISSWDSTSILTHYYPVDSSQTIWLIMVARTVGPLKKSNRCDLRYIKIHDLNN